MSGFEDHEGELQPGEKSDGFQAIDLSDVIEQFTAPFADVDMPPGFERLVESRLALTGLILRGLKSSVNPQAELQRLERAARETAIEQRLLGMRGYTSRITAKDIYEERKTSFKVELGDKVELVNRLAENSGTSRQSYLRHGNSWGFERKYEPYEHSGIEAVGISITTNPRSGHSEASLRMKIHPEIAEGEEDSIVGSLLQLRKVSQQIFQYKIPGQNEEEYRTREGKGRGLLFTDKDGSRIIIELKGHNLKMTHSICSPNSEVMLSEDTKIEPEKLKELEALDTQLLQDELKRLVGVQLDFAAEQFPAFIEHVAGIWDKQLPEQILKPRVGANSGELGLFDLDEDKEVDDSSIPDEVTDKRQRSLYIQTVRPNPKTNFEMVGGLDEEVKHMKQAISKAMHPERYESVGLDPRATVLLVGPPGTGKTMMAEAVATEIDGIFLAVKGSDIMSMWAGEAEKNVAGLFDLVETLGKEHKVVLFLDEIEAVAPSRASQHMMEHERKITAEFLSALNRKYDNAIIIGATNAPANVDAAVTRPGRFTDIITVGNPNKTGRLHIITNWLDYYRDRATVEVFDGVDAEQLAEASEGLNGADLRTIVETAIVNEVEGALETGRTFRSLGTTALLGHIKTHKAATAERFANYLGNPIGAKLEDQGFVFVRQP
jgi:SpoVK/Ycf46/Vps4 family AAA+-type ATPase